MNLAASIPLFGFWVVAWMPVIVFRCGRFNLRWLATAAPFLASALGLILGFAGWIDPWFIVPKTIPIVGTVGAIVIIYAAARSHDHAPALWHQSDLPRQLVHWGAYRYVRHPFYSAFLLLFLTAWFALPSTWTLLALVYGVVALHITARGEELCLIRLFGDAYRSYMGRTGRFVPPLKVVVRTIQAKRGG